MSIAPEILEAMKDAGASIEVIIAAVRADAALADQAVEERRAKDRERQRRHRASRGVAVTNGDSVTEPSPLTPPLKSPPDPLKITPPISPQPPRDGRARACRIEADWKPEKLSGKAAEMVARWQAGELERELAKFKNYWMAKAGKDACKLSWQRTWINWLISADERKPSNGRTNGVGRDQPSDGLSSTARAALQVFGSSSTGQH